jgi:L-lysine 6-transaminase
MGEYFLGKLQELEEKDAPIGNVRGRGLFIAFDLTDMAARNKLIKDAYDNDLLLLQSGTCSIRLRPHLDIKKEVIDHALEILEQLWHLR